MIALKFFFLKKKFIKYLMYPINIDPNSLDIPPVIYNVPVPVPVLPFCYRRQPGYYGSNFMQMPCVNRCGWNGWTSFYT
jgi:hypothetical protein